MGPNTVYDNEKIMTKDNCCKLQALKLCKMSRPRQKNTMECPKNFGTQITLREAVKRLMFAK